jgi:hypothetical protein
MIPSPYSRKASHPEGARRGRSNSGTRSPRQANRPGRTFSPPSSPRGAGLESPRLPLSPKSHTDSTVAPMSPSSLYDGLKSLTDNSPRGGGSFGFGSNAGRARDGAGQQENDDAFSPHVFEQDLLMSVSNLIDHFRSHPDGLKGASTQASASASVASSSARHPTRQLKANGSLVLDEETLRNVSLFVRMLQQSDGELAGELDNIVKALSSDDQSTDITSLTMKKETCQALEAYIGVMSGRRMGPSPERSHRLPTRVSPGATAFPGPSSRQISPRSAKSSPAKIQSARPPQPDQERAGARTKSAAAAAAAKSQAPQSHVFSFLGRFVDAVSDTLSPQPEAPSDPVIAKEVSGCVESDRPPAVANQDSGIAGFRSVSNDSMERFQSSPRSAYGEAVCDAVSDDSMMRFTRSPHQDQNDPLLSETGSLDHEVLVQENSGVASARSLLTEGDEGAASPAHGVEMDLQKHTSPTNPLVVARHAISSWNSGIGLARSDDELLVPTLSDADTDQKSSLLQTDMEETRREQESSSSDRGIVIDDKQATEAVEVLPSETFTSNDLDTVALSILGHYIDKVATSPDKKTKNVPSRRESPTIVFDDPIQALRFEQQRGDDEPEHEPVVELCESMSSNEDFDSQHSTDLSSFAPAVAAAKAAMEAVSTTPRRQQVDPPSVTTAGSNRSDPPTHRSPRKVDVDLTHLPSSSEEELELPLTVEVMSPRHEEFAGECFSPKRDPDATNDPPLIDTTGELNPRLRTPTAPPHMGLGNRKSCDLSPSVASAGGRFAAGQSTISSWNSPSVASSMDRGSVKIIFFDKTKPKRKRSKKTTGVEQPPSFSGELQNNSPRGTHTPPQPESPISIDGQNDLRRAPPTSPVSDTSETALTLAMPNLDVISGSIMGRAASCSVLEPIVETPTLENSLAPTLSAGTMPDDVPFSVSALRNEMGSSEADASVAEEERKLNSEVVVGGDLQEVLEHTNAQMRDLLSQSDADETLRKLWNLIPQPEAKPTKGKPKPEENTNFTFEKFAALIDMTFPFFDGRMPTAVEKAHLQVQARRKQIPVVMTNTLMDTLHSLPASEAALDVLPVPQSIQDLSISEHSSIRKEALLRRLLRLKEAERRRDVMIYSTAVSTEEEAVEIDLAGLFQFAMNEYESSSDESVDEPWWKSTAKLNEVLERSRDSDDLGFVASSSREYYDTETDTDNESHAPNVRKAPSVEDEIRGFWKTRKRRPKYYKLRHRGGLPSVGTASFSANDNDGASASVSSASTNRFDREADEEQWTRKRDIAMWPNGPNGGWLSRLTTNSWIRSPEPINAVNATVYFVLPSFIKRRFNPGTKQWNLPYEPRIATHKGYFNVNVKSLYDASSQYGIQHPQDLLPWERRDVKQRFLQEQSVSYNRNWFGTTKKVYGNDRLRLPVCRPKSMEMPMKAGEWTEEWYKKPWDSLSLAQSLSVGDADLKEIAAMRKRYGGTDDEDEASWEETPECGTIRNVKLKIGERVTRVTPDITCSLRRSRWRKKFFPKGTFPY